MVEIYPKCLSRSFSGKVLTRLETGWAEVFKILHQIGEGVISEIELIEITFLDDDEMARLHGEFLGDATTTDVITFDHGELLIGVETAERQSLEFETNIYREIALYGIHGMLHLAGFDDISSKDAELMENRQNDLFRQLFADLV